jgi:hypothetical protein
MGRVVQYELHALGSEHRDQVLAVRHAIEDDVRRVVDAGVKSKAFAMDDVRGATTMVLSLCVDVARWYRPGGRLTPEQIGDLVGDAALRIVGAAQPAR